MGSNSFGKLFQITTWGESHGKKMGVVIDGCPAGLKLNPEEIERALRERSPGYRLYTSSRKEDDAFEILSGVFEGTTTGAPISIVIENNDADSSAYTPIKDILRPGHANYTYLQKYGLFDYRGGGRASARETACRVAAGSVAAQLLKQFGIELIAYTEQIGDVSASIGALSFDELKKNKRTSAIFCPDPLAEKRMLERLEKIHQEGDSLGGIVGLQAFGLPVGLGDPVYAKLDAMLSFAMLSVPASKGFEIGEGFSCVSLKGSEHNDSFELSEQGAVKLGSNHAGGLLGGISTGEPLKIRVAFKPTSSISKPQDSVNLSKEKVAFQLPPNSRHDPCLAIRAVPVVEAMAALTLIDAVLMNRVCRI